MNRVKYVPNPMRPDGGFVVADQEGKPYLDGLGRPIPGAGLQLPPALIDFGVPPVLGQRLVEVWNDYVDEASNFERLKALEPHHPSWCHRCHKMFEAKDLSELRCPGCGECFTTSAVPLPGRSNQPPILVRTIIDRAPKKDDTRFGKFLVADHFHRWPMLKDLLACGLVVSAEYEGEHQAMRYHAWHPAFKLLSFDSEVPLYVVQWQGNRVVFAPFESATSITIEPKTFAPDWRSFQRLHPTSGFEVVWPNGDLER